jgi:hypothetical protein
MVSPSRTETTGPVKSAKANAGRSEKTVANMRCGCIEKGFIPVFRRNTPNHAMSFRQISS